MKVRLRQLLSEAIHRHFDSKDNKMLLPEHHINNTNQLYKELDDFIKLNNIPKEHLIIFGSSALGLKGLRTPNDLDIGIRKESIPLIKNKYKPAKGSYGAQYDIGKLSFIHELALPKFKGQSLFDQTLDNHQGFKTINFEQWKEMQKHDPLQKDKRFLNIN